MLVSINAITQSPCMLCCQKQDDAVEAVFHDGFAATLCKRHFWDALKARAGTPPKSPAERRETSAKGAP